MQAQIVDVKNFGNGVCYGCGVEFMFEAIRGQMERYREHNIEPRFVLMNVTHYRQMVEHAEQHKSARHNSDENSVNGLSVVICEHINEPTGTTSPGELMKHNLL